VPGVPVPSPRTTSSSASSRHSIDAKVGPVAIVVHGSGSVVVVEPVGCVVVTPPSDVVVAVLAVTVLVVVLDVAPGCVLDVVLAPAWVVVVVVVA
jgi:hypothetical protein